MISNTQCKDSQFLLLLRSMQKEVQIKGNGHTISWEFFGLRPLQLLQPKGALARTSSLVNIFDISIVQ